MRIVMMGTPDFAVPCLERLVRDGHDIPLVVTQPDKPKGRSQELTPLPMKVCAAAHGIPVFQPVKMKAPETAAAIAAARPELIVVVAYGRILPKSILDIPPRGCINVHGSLLPRYRGAAPVQWAVLNGDRQSGVTTMWMNEGLDTGDMLLKKTRDIPEDMTAGELFDALCEDGAALLADTLAALEAGTLTATPQNDAEATYAPMLTKDMSAIDWNRPAAALHNQVRGLHPWPVATCTVGGKRMKLHQTAVGGACRGAAGTVVALNPLSIACGDGNALILKEVQTEGGKRMPAADFLRGHPLAVGQPLL